MCTRTLSAQWWPLSIHNAYHLWLGFEEETCWKIYFGSAQIYPWKHWTCIGCDWPEECRPVGALRPQFTPPEPQMAQKTTVSYPFYTIPDYYVSGYIMKSPYVQKHMLFILFRAYFISSWVKLLKPVFMKCSTLVCHTNPKQGNYWRFTIHGVPKWVKSWRVEST